MKWSVVYKRAIQEDGSLLFPERLTHEFLANARKTMGSYLFANQYMNEVIPEDEKRFKPNWLRTSTLVPENVYHFAFIDPAIGQHKRHDYTGVCVVAVDYQGNWYLRLAQRYRLTPTGIVDKMFEIHQTFKPMAIGVETIAYQEALLYILDEKMKRDQKIIPVTGIKGNQSSKSTRILGLVPRFEWGKIFVAPGQVDFEDEYNTFPRGTHDDILDALARLEEIVYYPQKKEATIEKPNSPSDPSYEQWYRANLAGKARDRESPY